LNPWLATFLAVGGFLLGTVFNAWTGIADRLVGRRARKGDLAAVSLLASAGRWESSSAPRLRSQGMGITKQFSSR
jgi:hypothetical protein